MERNIPKIKHSLRLGTDWPRNEHSSQTANLPSRQWDLLKTYIHIKTVLYTFLPLQDYKYTNVCSVQVSILNIRNKTKNPSNQQKTYTLISSIILACFMSLNKRQIQSLPTSHVQLLTQMPSFPWNGFCKAALSSILRQKIGLYFWKSSGRSMKVSGGSSLRFY